MSESWYALSGKDGDVVLSTRIRLARNLKNYPFPIRMTSAQKETVISEVEDAVLNSNSYISSDFRCIRMEDISNASAASLVEKHLVSPEFIRDPEGKAVIINSDESISIMINEEDHIRIQVMKEGSALEETYGLADKIDSLISEKLDIAFDSRLGFLTQCPTNLGTGMRASLMMHLPALKESGAMSKIASNLSKLGITIRGSYGEGSEVEGAVYQLSNQITLGLTESEALSNLIVLERQLMEKERAERSRLVQDVKIQDKICRSLGLLKHARLLSSSEFMKLVSLIRLGISEKLISGVSFADINRLVNEIQPGTMGAGLSAEQRDYKRAEKVRMVLSSAR